MVFLIDVGPTTEMTVNNFPWREGEGKERHEIRAYLRTSYMKCTYPLLQEGYGDHGSVLRQPEGADGALVLGLAERLHARVDDLDGLAILVGLYDVANKLK